MTIPLVEALEREFRLHASPKVAAEQEAYMRDLFPFLGIQKPLRTRLQSALFKGFPLEEALPLIEALWAKEEREFQYAAVDLAVKASDRFSEKALPTIEQMIRNKSWWDTVDRIASRVLGPLLHNYSSLLPLMDRWIANPSLWIRRAALLHQLRYREQTDAELLFRHCRALMHEEEFFIQKAIGWALREYSKSAPDAVAHFIREVGADLSPLSRREGSRLI